MTDENLAGDNASIRNISFSAGDWVVDKHNPSQPGQYTGKFKQAGPHLMIQLVYPSGGKNYRPLACLEKMRYGPSSSMEELLKAGRFGKSRDLKRLIVFEKLKGTLHEVIYSMEAAQIDFYPYQFKPVIKFVNSPTERLILADEVGLGKTIEAALIWVELQARRQAKRLLVVCPNLLAEKWRDELRSKFLFDARIVPFSELAREVSELKMMGPGHPFVLIGTYTGLRPPKAERELLRESPDAEPSGSPKTRLLRELYHWPLDYNPFDLVIFDEAHYMRNPATTTFHLGVGLSACAGAVLCVSATPVNNSNTDLHSLLRLIDEDFFETQELFDDLLEANRPTVKAGNALARMPVDMVLLRDAIEGMRNSKYISSSPLFKQLMARLDGLDPDRSSEIAECQELVEKLNLMGGYVNRTRRVQVKEGRPLRDPVVLSVTYSRKEMELYNMILRIVREKCRVDDRPFHVFQVLGLQLRAASCLPVLAEEIRSGRFGDVEDLLGEAFGEEVTDDLLEDTLSEELDSASIGELLAYDFETNDSKYNELRRMLLQTVSDEKVVVFAYYRPTLAYLKRRLSEDGATVTVIHGGIKNEQRWAEIDRFRDPRGPRILLSSEVGSEGIDLQFCRVLVNYDLPWNPMRVEQRIGRIDRVGQQASRISVVNFKIKDTVEERLYERLHQKLERFANSLGDLEAVIGKEVQLLTVDLLSKELTPEEEIERMARSERVIEERLIQIQALEESGDVLTGLSDYIQRKIEEDRQRGRYIQPEELEDYLCDFFEREFQGCIINHNTPLPDCFQVRLSQDARTSLSDFIRDDRSLSATPLRQKEFHITFKRETAQRLQSAQKKTIHFATHLSPLIRWITRINSEREHTFFKVAALKLVHPEMPPGDYCYRIERWRLEGLSTRERLAYGVLQLSGGTALPADDAEVTVQDLLRHGKDWDYVDCDREQLVSTHRSLEEELSNRFVESVEDFEAENETMYHMKVQRIESFYARRIQQHEQRIRTLGESRGDPRAIRLAEGLRDTAIQNKRARLGELGVKKETVPKQDEVAAGVFRVLSTVQQR